MNIQEVFYFVAIVYMTLHTVVLLAVVVVVIRFVKSMQSLKDEVASKIKGIEIAKYSIQLSLLKNILGLFGRRRGGDYS